MLLSLFHCNDELRDARVNVTQLVEVEDDVHPNKMVEDGAVALQAVGECVDRDVGVEGAGGAQRLFRILLLIGDANYIEE